MFKKAFDIYEQLDAFFNIMAKKYPISENINTERIKQNKNIFCKSIIFIFPHYINIDCSHNILHISKNSNKFSALKIQKLYKKLYKKIFCAVKADNLFHRSARSRIQKIGFILIGFFIDEYFLLITF